MWSLGDYRLPATSITWSEKDCNSVPPITTHIHFPPHICPPYFIYPSQKEEKEKPCLVSEQKMSLKKEFLFSPAWIPTFSWGFTFIAVSIMISINYWYCHAALKGISSPVFHNLMKGQENWACRIAHPTWYTIPATRSEFITIILSHYSCITGILA